MPVFWPCAFGSAIPARTRYEYAIAPSANRTEVLHELNTTP